MLLGLLARDPVTLPRVTAQDVGGAFGVKVLPTREDVAVLAAAVDLGRSVKWIEDRNEHLLIAGQAARRHSRSRPRCATTARCSACACT